MRRVANLATEIIPAPVAFTGPPRGVAAARAELAAAVQADKAMLDELAKY